MRLTSGYALLIAAPLAFSMAGCAGTWSLARAGRRSSESEQQRLLAIAQIYESQGQLASAHHAYCQILQKDPNHAVAREHAQNLLMAMRDGQHPAQPAVPGTPSSENTALAKAGPAQPPRPLNQPALARRGPQAAPKSDMRRRELPAALAAAGSTPGLTETAATRNKPVLELLPAPESLPTITAAQRSAPLTIVEPVVDHEGRWVPTALARLCPRASAAARAEVERLTSTDPEVRKAALQAIVDLGEEGGATSPAIRACLSDPDPAVQAYAAWALWQTTGDADDSTRSLRSVLSCGQQNAQTLACYILGSMGTDAGDMTTELAVLQNHDAASVRIHAAEALLRISDGDSGSVVVLNNVLLTGAADERSLAVLALASAKGADRAFAIDSLIAALQDDSPAVRAGAALTLGGFGEQAARAAAPLQLAAATSDSVTRDAVQTALACIRK